MSTRAHICQQRPDTMIVKLTRISLVLLILGADSVTARGLGGAWEPQGPGPNTMGQVENIQDGEVVGAIHTAAAHPTNADILFAGAVNGGIWRTNNATSASPNWTHQTDDQEALSIGALEFDPTDVTAQTLVAGIGRYSSFGGIGGPRVGLLRTVNGGAFWTPLDGGGQLIGRNISGVAPRGSTIVVSVNALDVFDVDNLGILRSTDTGATFDQISIGDGSATGLPGGITHDLASDPSDPSILYTAVVRADLAGGVTGIYRSTDTGATWTKVSTAVVDALFNNGTSNVEFSVGMANNVYAIIVNGGAAAAVVRSGNGGASWTVMDLPGTSSGGIHPGFQGSLHLSIAADLTDPNIVYVGGDRQLFPNQIGATDFSGRLFRGDASQPSGSQWVHLTHSNVLGPAGGGTASSSSPHADSRQMVIDANGEIIQTDDGGIYRRTNPRDNTGDWFSINGDIQTTELHSSSYDNNTDTIIGGAQDTGTPSQLVPEMLTWFSVSTADGGDVAVDTTSSPGMSVRYSSFQNLASFRREVYDSDNMLISRAFPALTVIDGGNPLITQFVTPIAVNAVEGNRLIIGGINSVYESLDQGDTLSEVGVGISINAGGRNAIAYGVAGNPGLLYVGDDSSVFVRTAEPPAILTQSASYPGSGTVADIVIDPDTPATAFVIDTSSVYRTTTTGETWSDVTGDLGTFDTGNFRSAAYINGATEDALVVGTSKGVFAALESTGFTTWSALGTGFPVALVFDLDYDAARDLLVAGTMGRGAWRLSAPLTETGLLFTDSFESGSTSAWSSTTR